MKPYVLVVAGVWVGVCSVVGPVWGEEIREGKWEYTSETTMEGMPPMPELPPGVTLPEGMAISSKGNVITTTYTDCLTKEDMIPSNADQAENCTTTKMERTGNTLKWAMTCNEEGTVMQGEGVATYSGETMTSTVKSSTTSEGQTMRQTMTIKGRYLGPCQ